MRRRGPTASDSDQPTHILCTRLARAPLPRAISERSQSDPRAISERSQSDLRAISGAARPTYDFAVLDAFDTSSGGVTLMAGPSPSPNPSPKLTPAA